ncbi:MAG: hypothetical protein J6T33_08080 [Bacteroidales bacterium]|nr:hypothetical protein [Bacteroidales bacterium]MBO7541600.1 hypothetical protein [Bacteroidales bacterium]
MINGLQTAAAVAAPSIGRLAPPSVKAAEREAKAAAMETAAQAAQTATDAASYIIGSKTFEYQPQLVQKAAAGPAAVPTTTPTVAPSNPPAQPKTWKDYLLWIALGGVVAFGAYKMLSGGKKKRR